MQKIKIGHRAKFRDRDNFFPQVSFPFLRDFTPYFHFRCVVRATFDRNLIHSADACYGVCNTAVKYLRMPVVEHFRSRDVVLDQFQLMLRNFCE